MRDNFVSLQLMRPNGQERESGKTDEVETGLPVWGDQRFDVFPWFLYFGFLMFNFEHDFENDSFYCFLI